MAVTKEQRLSDIHEEALVYFDRIQEAIRDERIQCLDDRRFCSITGAQWEGPIFTQFENKPMLEINKIQLSVIRIFNDYRNNRIDVSFMSKDGSDRADLADTCNMLYRADEQDSSAQEAYDNAFEEAVTGGFGAWRLRTAYENEEDPDDERQRIVIEPISDADSCVFFDLDAKRQDKKDATKCYVLTAMSPESFMETYDEDPSTWPTRITRSGFDWSAPHVVYIAEYYRIEEKRETIHIYRGLDGSEERVSDTDLKDDEDLAHRLEVTGFREVRQKKIKRKRVHKYIMSGNSILEDCGFIAGNRIPIVPVYGKRWFVDNVERCMGHVRLAKDAQRLKNMQISKLAEIAAVSSIQKPIFTPEQMAGHSVMWSDDSINDYPYLLANAMTDTAGNPMPMAPPYTQPPAIPPAMAALLQLTDIDMKEVLGNQEAGEQIVSNMSGKAVELVQQRLDMQTYIYVSNFAKAIKCGGEIWLSMAREVLVEEGRKMKGLSGQGKPEQIVLMQPGITEEGETGYINDLAEADFDVAVEVGPSSASKKQATVRALTSLMSITQDPETLQVLGGMAMMNMEGEGIQDVQDYFRKKLVRMGVVKPTDEELEQLQAESSNAKPDPNAQFLQAAAEEAQAKAAGARANTILTVAKAKKTEADTLKVMSDVDLDKNDQALRALDMMGKATKGETPRGA